MMRKLIFLFVIICSLLRAQPGQNFILSECNFIPMNGSFQLNYSYRIPYSRIVFELDKNGYYALYRINVEIFDSAGNFLTRGMTEKKLTVKSYDESVSKNLFTEGLIKFNVEQTSLTIIPIFTDLITNNEIKSMPVNADVTGINGDFLSPIVVDAKLFACDDKGSLRLTNFGGMIPFDRTSYDLIFPVTDVNLTSINCIVLNNEDTVFNSAISENTITVFTYSLCDNKIIIEQPDEEKVFKLFLLKNISNKLEVGTLTILLSSTENFEKINTFKKEVRWFNKPFTLNNQELSSRVLKYIEDEDTISEIRKTDEEKFLQKLLQVWEKYDPTKETKYNELMEQYYLRVDYAIKNFSTITGKQGWETDRGGIYIQFGNPDEIKRSSDDHGKVVETWIYTNPGNWFNFVDKTGTGEFVILSQK